MFLLDARGADSSLVSIQSTSSFRSAKHYAPSFLAKNELIVGLTGENALSCTSSKQKLASIRRETAHFFSATRMQTPDQRLCPNPDGGVLLNGITPKLFAAKGNRTSR